MTEFRILKFLDLFTGVFNRIGVDYPVMRSILRIKLTMDRRKSSTVMNNNRGDKEKSTFGASLLIFGFMGLMLGMYMLMPLPVFFIMSIILTVMMFCITLTMVADFSTVLLDLRDKNIILKAPVSYKTLNAAKTVHIIIYMSTVMSAFAAVPLVVALFKYGIGFFLVFLLELILMAVSIIFFTSIIYYIILSLFDGEKLKDIINYVQIIFTIVITIGQQVAGRFFNIAGSTVTFEPKWWCYLIPSFWMSAPLAMIKEGQANPNYLYLSIAGVTMPLLLFVVYIRLIAPRFEVKLQKLATVEKGLKKGRFRKWYFDARARLLCRNKTERGLYNFIINVASSERKLKLSLYPSIAMSAIFPFIFVFTTVDSGKSFRGILEQAGRGKQYLFMYMTVMVISSGMMIISRSENCKAAWVYRVMPIEKPAIIYKATIKALISRFALPVYLLQSIIFLTLCGPRIVPDLIVMFLSVILASFIIMAAGTKALPFSEEFSSSNAGNTGMAFLVMLIAAVLGGIHFGATFLRGGTVILGIVVVMILVIMWKSAFNYEWKDI